jgi:uncharacterized membrane-anchored protein YhcB (DUF1043 family)
MSDENKQPKPELTEFNLAAAELAYRVISHYVDHAQIAGIIIGVMAARLGEEGVKPIAQSEYWQGYMASKRNLNEAREDIERLSRLLERMQAERATPAA